MFQAGEFLRWGLSAAVVALVALIVLTLFGKPHSADDATVLLASPMAEADTTAAPQHLAPTVAPPKLAVDIIGAVQQPGVYYVESTARVNDVVNAAGGLAPDADRERINLAAFVVDGQQIKVPRVGEADQPGVAAAEGAPDSTSLVDINTADAELLEELPGIGPATAEAIISYRSANGPFARIEDVQNVKGIGPSTFDELKDRITVSP